MPVQTNISALQNEEILLCWYDKIVKQVSLKYAQKIQNHCSEKSALRIPEENVPPHLLHQFHGPSQTKHSIEASNIQSLCNDDYWLSSDHIYLMVTWNCCQKIPQKYWCPYGSATKSLTLCSQLCSNATCWNFRAKVSTGLKSQKYLFLSIFGIYIGFWYRSTSEIKHSVTVTRGASLNK